MNVTFASGILEEIVEHARACAPQECCGLIVGRDRGERAIRMTNALASATVYEMDPAELIPVLRSLRESGDELIAIYHSHPQGPPSLSARDVAGAHYPEAAQVVISLDDADRPVIKAFRIVDGRPFEIEVHAIV